MVLPLFPGCSTNTVDEDTLVVWEAGLDPDYKSTLVVDPDNRTAQFTKLIVDKFEADNPGKTVRLVYAGWGESLNMAITNAIISREEVDLIAGEIYVQRLIDGEFFVPIEGVNYKDRILPFLYDRYNTAEETYAVPAYGGSFVLFVNKGTLRKAGIIDENDAVTEEYRTKYEEAGIDPLDPETFEDMLVVCQDVRAASSTGLYGGTIINDVPTGDDSAWRALAYMKQAGGDYVNENGEPYLNSPENQKAFEMMVALNETAPKNSEKKANTNDIIQYFRANNIAYLVEGSSVLTLIGQRDPAYGEVLVRELPQFEGVNIKSNVSVGSVYYSIPVHSQKQELAKAFIETLLSDEVQLAAVQLDSRVPAVTTVLNSDAIKTEEYRYSEMQAFYAPYIEDGYTDVEPLHAFENNISLIWDAWRSFVNSVFSQHEPLAEYLESTQNQMMDLYTRE